MFKYFISLGWFCGTASSLAKYGLRSFSGPFDWYYSELEGIIHFLSCDFQDFLCKDNLKCLEDRKLEFEDCKYGFHFNHDVKRDFDEEYDSVYEKYMKRIMKFRYAVKEKSCFVRAVRSNEELTYILNNEKMISELVRQYNPDNEIVYLVPQYMKIPNGFSSKYFSLNINEYRGHTQIELQSLFDTSKEFVDFCLKQYDRNSRKDNLIFELTKEVNKYKKLEVRHNLLLKILRMDFEKIKIPNKIAIYGLGDNGKFFYERVKDKCTVECFIDAEPKEDMYEGVHVISAKNYIASKDTIIIVTPTYAFEEINNKLEQTCDMASLNVISLEKLLTS